MNRMKYIIMLLLLILSLESNAIDKSLYFSFGEKFSSSLYTYKISEDSIRTTIMFKLMNDNLNFKKTTAGSKSEVFFAEPEIELVLKDKQGVIRKRDLWKEKILITGYLNTISKKNFIYGFKTLDLKNEDYQLEVKLISKRNSRDNEKIIDINKVIDGSLAGSPFFVSSNSNDKFQLKPHVMDKAYGFHRKNTKLLIPIAESISDLNIEIKKKKTDNDDRRDDSERNIYGQRIFETDVEGRIIKSQNLSIRSVNNELNLDLLDSETGMDLLVVDLPENQMIPGEYTLKIPSISFRYDFELKWDDRPIALSDMDFAIEKMYYILTDEAYEDLKDGSKERQFEKFLYYWKQKDPSPETPFNEAMVQYFERVDFAFFNFQTLPEKDGASTDRGKIYILNGPPDIIENKSKDGKAVIEWTYSKYREKYIFEAIQSGIFKLVEIKD